MSSEPLLSSKPDVVLDAPAAFSTVDTTAVKPLKSSVRASNRFGDLFKGETLNEIARFGGYTSYDPPGNVDPYVAEAMKTWSRPVYESLRGKTRRGAGTSGLYDALMRFEGKKHRFADLPDQDKSLFRRVIANTRKAFTLGEKSEPLDWHEVGQYLRTDTSAGVTWPGKVKGDVLEEIYPAARWLGHRMKQGGRSRSNPAQIHFPPCLAAKRGHLSDREEPKTRLVWVYPAEMLCVEGLYAPKMYEKFAGLKDSPLMNGRSPSRVVSDAKAKLPTLFKRLGMDFSAFDATIPPFLIHIAFDILRDNINWETWRGRPVPDSQRRKWRNVWDNMVWYFINTPILMPDGRLFRKYRGVPSGSWWTQLVDSVVNHLVVSFLAEEQGEQALGLKVLGDDSLCSVRNFDIPRAMLTSKSRFGMIVNGEKSELVEGHESLKVLGTHYRKGVPYRESKEWFELLLYPEYPPSDLGVSMSRFVGLWLAGAMYDNLFCDFWRYFQSGYPVPGFGRFNRDQRRALRAQLQRDVGEWWSFSSSVFEYPYQVHS